MSLRNSKTEKKKPRAMPVETIVTRFKSAQQKRLLEKEIKTKKSKIIKTTKISRQTVKTSERKSPRHRKVQNLKKNPEKFSKETVDDTNVENNEYYPNKLKRTVLNARIFLAPKHSFKVVCGTKSCNKRKLHMPQRDVKYIKEQLPHQDPELPNHKAPSPELTVTDMVRIIEENGSLDDEDLLEILTCPSPVWWEEPLDGYLEEPITSEPRPIAEQIQNKEMKEEQKINHEESNNNNDKNEINLQDSMEITITNKDKNFINKRCHLESLLGNIRNKVIKPIRDNSHVNESKTTNDLKEIEMEQKIKKIKVKTNSECTEEDLVEFRDDEILKHLENLEIPIEAHLKKEECDPLQLRRMSTESSEKNMSVEYLDLSLLEEDDKEHSMETDVEHINVDDSNKNEDNVNSLTSKSSHSEENLNPDLRDEILNVSTNCDVEENIDVICINSPTNSSVNISSCTEEKLHQVICDEILNAETKSDVEQNINVIYVNSPKRSAINISSCDEEKLHQVICDEILNASNAKSDAQQNINVIYVNSPINSLTNNSSNEENHHQSICDEIVNVSDTKSHKEQNFDVNHDENEQNLKITELHEQNIEVTKNTQSNEYVTVYKILNNDSKEPQNDTNKQISNEIDKRKDIKDNADRKIDSYYKLCKKINNSIKTIKDIKNFSLDDENSQNSSIMISDTDNVRYCFICSSIFDTDKCHYCLQRKEIENKDSCEKCGSDIENQDNVELLSEND